MKKGNKMTDIKENEKPCKFKPIDELYTLFSCMRDDMKKCRSTIVAKYELSTSLLDTIDASREHNKNIDVEYLIKEMQRSIDNYRFKLEQYKKWKKIKKEALELHINSDWDDYDEYDESLWRAKIKVGKEFIAVLKKSKE